MQQLQESVCLFRRDDRNTGNMKQNVACREWVSFGYVFASGTPVNASHFQKLGFNSEKAMATHSSTLAWKIPWMEEPGGLQSTGLLRVGHDWVTFTFHFHALEEEMATHSSVLAWRIPGTAGPGGLPSMGWHKVGHDWSDLAAAAAAFLGRCSPLLV